MLAWSKFVVSIHMASLIFLISVSLCGQCAVDHASSAKVALSLSQLSVDHFATSCLFSVLMKMQARSSAFLFSLRTLSIAGPFLSHHHSDCISHLASNFCDGFYHSHSTSHRVSCLVLNLHIKPYPKLATSGIYRNTMAFLYKDHSSLAFLYLRVYVFIHSSDGHHRYQLKLARLG